MTTMGTAHVLHSADTACEICAAPRSQDYDESIRVGRGLFFGIVFSLAAWAVIAGIGIAVWIALH